MVTGVVLPPPRPVLPSFLLDHRVQYPLIVDISSSVANVCPRAFRTSISAQDKEMIKYALGENRTHGADPKLARGYILIRHRGSERYRAGRPGGLVGVHSNTTAINNSVGP